MINFLGKFYVKLLWLAGAALTDKELEELKGKGDRITYWMRRSKKRLKKWWWVAVICSILLHTIILYDNIKHRRWWKVAIGCLGYIFLIYVIPHVVFGCW